MDFKDLIKQLSERVEKLKGNLQTEEATKNALIMPFIQALGYDVFNPLEVVPEYTCDAGTKKGEKIDYAILKDDKPAILIECKHCVQNLDLHDNQLLRYFNVSPAKFAILTNGVTYRFYTDLDKANVMDEKPFLELDMMDVRDSQIEELKKFHKSYYDVDKILDSATELKYTNELKKVIEGEFTDPSIDFVKLFARPVYPGPLTAKVVEQFTVLLRKSIQNYISDLIKDRLNNAIKQEEIAETQAQVTTPTKQLVYDQSVVSTSEDGKIVTTREEIEGFMITKNILRQCVSASRIFYRDAQSYFAILLDDNNRKTICRLYLDGKTKWYIGIFDEEKKETRFEIQSLDDIYNYADQLREVVERFENSKVTA